MPFSAPCKTTNPSSSRWNAPRPTQLSPQSRRFQSSLLNPHEVCWLGLLINSEDFSFFRGAEIFDFLGLRMRDLFQFVQRTLLLIFADLLVFFEFFDRFLDVPPDIADRCPVIFEHLV